MYKKASTDQFSREKKDKPLQMKLRDAKGKNASKLSYSVNDNYWILGKFCFLFKFSKISFSVNIKKKTSDVLCACVQELTRIASIDKI